MGLLSGKSKTNGDENVPTVQSLTAELGVSATALADAEASVLTLTAKNAELASELSVFTTKSKIEAKASTLGVVIPDMGAFIEANPDYETQVDALFELKAKAIGTNTDNFLEGAPKPVGELGAEDDEFVPATKAQAMAHLKTELPELSARERQAEGAKRYPKVWEK